MESQLMEKEPRLKKQHASASGDPDYGDRTLASSEYGRRPDGPDRRRNTGGTSMNTDGIAVMVLFAGVIAVFVGLPLLFIWVLNTLFKAGIAYGLAEWFAAAMLMVLVVALTYIGSSLAKD